MHIAYQSSWRNRCWFDYNLQIRHRQTSERTQPNGPKKRVSAWYNANLNIIIAFKHWQLCARNVLLISPLFACFYRLKEDFLFFSFSPYFFVGFTVIFANDSWCSNFMNSAFGCSVSLFIHSLDSKHSELFLYIRSLDLEILIFASFVFVRYAIACDFPDISSVLICTQVKASTLHMHVNVNNNAHREKKIQKKERNEWKFAWCSFETNLYYGRLSFTQPTLTSRHK